LMARQSFRWLANSFQSILIHFDSFWLISIHFDFFNLFRSRSKWHQNRQNISIVCRQFRSISIATSKLPMVSWPGILHTIHMDSVHQPFTITRHSGWTPQNSGLLPCKGSKPLR
jgi:hypothetical protein